MHLDTFEYLHEISNVRSCESFFFICNDIEVFDDENVIHSFIHSFIQFPQLNQVSNEAEYSSLTAQALISIWRETKKKDEISVSGSMVVCDVLGGHLTLSGDHQH